ncbi:MAG: hypothetical protein AAEI92_02680, partial [Arenicellales bacterium]
VIQYEIAHCGYTDHCDHCDDGNGDHQFDQGKTARPHCDVRVIAGIWQLDIQGVYSFLPVFSNVTSVSLPQAAHCDGAHSYGQYGQARYWVC